MPVEVANESEIAVDEAELAGICRFVLGEMQVNPLAELSVLCVDVEYMSSLHERWMREKGPTDVLAFPMDELDTARPDDPERGPALLTNMPTEEVSRLLHTSAIGGRRPSKYRALR